jgi:hypothetical protein
LRLLNAATVQIRRSGAGSRLEGRWIPGVEETFDIKCNIQPFTERYFSKSEIEEKGFLPENIKIIFTKETLRYSNQDKSGTLEADKVVFLGKTYSVIGAQEWAGSTLPGMRTNHNVYMVVELVL